MGIINRESEWLSRTLGDEIEADELILYIKSLPEITEKISLPEVHSVQPVTNDIAISLIPSLYERVRNLPRNQLFLICSLFLLLFLLVLCIQSVLKARTVANQENPAAEDL